MGSLGTSAPEEDHSSNKFHSPNDVHVSHSLKEQAAFETTSRLLACLVNEGLVKAFTSSNGTCLCLRNPQETGTGSDELIVSVGLSEVFAENATFKLTKSLLHPEDLRLPVAIRHATGDVQYKTTEPDPVALFDAIYPWLGGNEDARRQIVQELMSSASNQAEWFQIAAHTTPPELGSPLIDWERAIIRGHPTHPMHRTCLAQAPLSPILPGEIPRLLEPEILFISVLRSDLHITGDFESEIRPLFKGNDIPTSAVPSDRIIIPCLARQLPAILEQLGPSVQKIPTPKPLHAQAQASLRTVSLPPDSAFPHHLKFALACKITSALRTITPWTANIGPEVSVLLQKLLPPTMWVFTAIAAVTGSNPDFDKAKHISVLIRENVELRARAHGETLIPAAALAERGIDNEECHAARIFHLDTLEKKKDWFRNYTHLLLLSTLPPLLHHGISLEAHGQNICARFSLPTAQLAGFAVRDFGGLKLHMPTLRAQGYSIPSSPPGSLITVEDRGEVWENAHHTIFNSHLGQLMRGLGLQGEGGWGIVRGEVEGCLGGGGEGGDGGLGGFLGRERVEYKCFIRMKMEGLYRDYIHQDVPNVLLY